MRILVLTDEIYPDAIGGVGKSLYNECAALVRRGHQVTVLVRALNHDLPPQSQIEGLVIVRFYGPKRNSYLYYFYPLSVILQVWRWVRMHDSEWDVISIHNPIFIIPAQLSGIRKKMPVVYTFYASIADEIRISANRGKYGRAKIIGQMAAGLLGKLERWGFAHVDAVFPRSIYTLEVLRSIYPEVNVPNANNLIPLGVDVSLYKEINPQSARKILQLPPDAPILITVRRLEGRMGLQNLIQATALVQQHFPDMRLFIAGKGYLKENLTALIEELDLEQVVTLLGFVSEDQLPLYLAASDLFVLPTEVLEGFGLATIEALAVGLPVIGTPIGATPEILNRVDAALLTRNTSVEALAEKISSWLNQPQELSDLRGHAYSVVRQTYDADHVASQLETLYRSIVMSREQN